MNSSCNNHAMHWRSKIWGSFYTPFKAKGFVFARPGQSSKGSLAKAVEAVEPTRGTWGPGSRSKPSHLLLRIQRRDGSVLASMDPELDGRAALVNANGNLQMAGLSIWVLACFWEESTQAWTLEKDWSWQINAALQRTPARRHNTAVVVRGIQRLPKTLIVGSTEENSEEVEVSRVATFTFCDPGAVGPSGITYGEASQAIWKYLNIEAGTPDVEAVDLHEVPPNDKVMVGKLAGLAKQALEAFEVTEVVSEELLPVSAGGAGTVDDFVEDDPALARLPLQISDDFEAAIQALAGAGFYAPRVLRSCLEQLAVGHLLLTGPPGTGKTRLARALAGAFEADLVETTANAEWSSHDLIGSVTLDAGGGVVPRDGVVTSSISRCYERLAEAEDDGPQAVWLLIDELNRADIDRAFGALFTALSGDVGGKYALDYREGRPLRIVPARFRIIATLNTYDARFVGTLSAALRRRFGRVAVDVPETVTQKEHEVALVQARVRLQKKIELESEQIEILPPRSLTHAREAVEWFRGGAPAADGASARAGELRLPAATAHLIDLYEVLFLKEMTALHTTEDDVTADTQVDEALVSRVLNALETDATRALLGDGASYADSFAERFPGMPLTADKLRRFGSGVE